MQKKLFITFAVLLTIPLMLNGCQENEEPATNENTIVIDDLSAQTQEPDTSDPSQSTGSEANTTDAVQATTETAADAADSREFQNEYNENGEPLIVYEVIGNGENAAYSGNYNRYVYANGALRTMEKWTRSANGDTLVATTDYDYDGRGALQTITERLPDANGELYTYCKTERTNNYDGSVYIKTITYYAADGTAIQESEYTYTYDSRGNETFVTVSENGVVQNQISTDYVYDDSTLKTKIETTVQSIDNQPSKQKVVTTQFDARGNITERTEEDGNLTFITTYDYDANDREVGSRTVLKDGSVSEYTATEYEALGENRTRVTTRRFGSDGALVATEIICYDEQGNVFIP